MAKRIDAVGPNGAAVRCPGSSLASTGRRLSDGPRSYDDREPVREAAWHEAIAETTAERFAEVGEAWFARDGMEWRGEYRG